MENAKVTFVSRQVMPGLSFVNFSPRRNWEGEEAPKLTAAQEFIRNKEADTILFVDVLLDEAGERVFSDDDIGTVAEVYGQVHKRLLNVALALGVDQDQAEKSKATAYILSHDAGAPAGAHTPRTAQHPDGQ
jgi:hypothetical protein